jgi:hypothetical protein
MPLSITLPAERWTQVLGMLAEAPIPHRLSDPLIREIQAQCQMHEMRARAGQAPPRLVPQDYGPIADGNGQAPPEGPGPPSMAAAP